MTEGNFGFSDAHAEAFDRSKELEKELEARQPRPRPPIRQTHTYVELEVTPAVYDEIRRKLEAAQYQHTFMDGGAIDMQGIAITRGANPTCCECCPHCDQVCACACHKP